jgi:DNA-binding MarR family transcriptional regulator
MRLIVRAREGEDRRFVRARITSAGLGLLARLDDAIVELHRRQLGHLGHRKLVTLIELLDDAREAPSPHGAGSSPSPTRRSTR